MTTSRRLVAALAAAALLLSACGSDDTAETSTTAAAPAASSDDAASSSPETADESTVAESADDAGDATIIGGDVDTLDETSAAWFSTMCGGMAPLVEGLQALPTEPAAMGTLIEELGAGLVTTSDELAATEAPTFAGGDEYASAASAAFKEIGEKFQETAPLMAAGDSSALTTLSESMSESPLADLADSFNPELHDDIQALPACAPFFGA